MLLVLLAFRLANAGSTIFASIGPEALRDQYFMWLMSLRFASYQCIIPRNS
jgi:hypothetical protein